jgi:hypothetical protein
MYPIKDFEFLKDIEINCNNTEFLKEILYTERN